MFVGCWESVTVAGGNSRLHCFVSELPLWFCFERPNPPAAHSRCATDMTARSLEEDGDRRDGHTGPAGSQASQTAAGQLEIPLA